MGKRRRQGDDAPPVRSGPMGDVGEANMPSGELSWTPPKPLVEPGKGSSNAKKVGSTPGQATDEGGCGGPLMPISAPIWADQRGGPSGAAVEAVSDGSRAGGRCANGCCVSGLADA
jgi:hypothetical protein